MSEVKTYWVDLGGASFTGQMFGCNDEVVKVADFDAQRLSADKMEFALKEILNDCDQNSRIGVRCRNALKNGESHE